jgi:hypothetical protein
LVVGLMRLIHFATAAGGCSLWPSWPLEVNARGSERVEVEELHGSCNQCPPSCDGIYKASLFLFEFRSHCNNEIDLLQVWARSTMAGSVYELRWIYDSAIFVKQGRGKCKNSLR